MSQVLDGLILVDLAVPILKHGPLDFVVCFVVRLNLQLFFFHNIDVKKTRSVTLQYGRRTRLVSGHCGCGIVSVLYYTGNLN